MDLVRTKLNGRRNYDGLPRIADTERSLLPRLGVRSRRDAREDLSSQRHTARGESREWNPSGLDAIPSAERDSRRHSDTLLIAGNARLGSSPPRTAISSLEPTHAAELSLLNRGIAVAILLANPILDKSVLPAVVIFLVWLETFLSFYAPIMHDSTMR